jgi:hypothetical protein
MAVKEELKIHDGISQQKYQKSSLDSFNQPPIRVEDLGDSVNDTLKHFWQPKM